MNFKTIRIGHTNEVTRKMSEVLLFRTASDPRDANSGSWKKPLLGVRKKYHHRRAENSYEKIGTNNGL